MVNVQSRFGEMNFAGSSMHRCKNPHTFFPFGVGAPALQVNVFTHLHRQDFLGHQQLFVQALRHS